MTTLASFATPQDLADRLEIAVPTGAKLTRWQSALDDASSYLRGELGWQVYPTAEVTQTYRHQRGTSHLVLAGSPVRSVTTTTLDGTAVTDAELEDGALYRHCGWWGDASVTYTFGYDTAPADLVAWCCVLASMQLSIVDELGRLAGGAGESVAVDDYRHSWSSGGDGAGMSLPQRVLDRIRSNYGSGVAVTGARRP